MATEMMNFIKSRKPQAFNRKPFYSKMGDFLVFHFEGADHFAERIDESLTVYRSLKDRSVVGIKLKGISCLLKTIGNFRLDVYKDKVLELTMFLVAAKINSTSKEAIPMYESIVKDHKDIEIDKEIFSQALSA